MFPFDEYIVSRVFTRRIMEPPYNPLFARTIIDTSKLKAIIDGNILPPSPINPQYVFDTTGMTDVRAGCIVIRMSEDKSIEILAVKESASGYWGMPKGRCEIDHLHTIMEHPQHAACRETFEETNIIVKPENFINMLSFKHNVLYITGVFTGTPKPDGREILDVKWIHIDTFVKMNISSITRIALQRMQSQRIMMQCISALNVDAQWQTVRRNRRTPRQSSSNDSLNSSTSETSIELECQFTAKVEQARAIIKQAHALVV